MPVTYSNAEELLAFEIRKDELLLELGKLLAKYNASIHCYSNDDNEDPVTNGLKNTYIGVSVEGLMVYRKPWWNGIVADDLENWTGAG